MRRLKPAADPWFELDDRRRRPSRDAIDLVFGTAWMVLTLPFRLVFGVVGLVGRIAGLAVGFAMMVLGAALLAGPMMILGLPLFVVGLLVAMRSLG